MMVYIHSGHLQPEGTC